MFKTRMLVVWANEGSINNKREIHFSITEAYIKLSKIQGIFELQSPPNKNFGDWKDQETQSWISEEREKGNVIYPFKILMDNGAVFNNVLLTFEERNMLLKLIEQGNSLPCSLTLLMHYVYYVKVQSQQMGSVRVLFLVSQQKTRPKPN